MALKKTKKFKIKITKNFKRLKDASDAQTIVLVGSTRSSKTWSIIQYLIDRCERDADTTVFSGRHDGTTCKKTIIKDFKKIMMTQFGTWKDSHWNGRDSTYTWPNGSSMMFGGTQDIGKLHGMGQKITWLNEANDVAYEAYTQLEFRTTVQIILDMNPSDPDTWVLKKVKDLESTVYIHSTYKDNPYLTKKQIEAIERYNPMIPINVKMGTADKYKWEVYGLGLPAAREGTIIPAHKWRTVEESDIPQDHQCNRIIYGLDFGVSVDPNALIKVMVCNNQIFLKELMYETNLPACKSSDNLNTASIELRLESAGIKKTDLIVADGGGVGAVYVRDLRRSGWNVMNAKKHNGSILPGINMMLNYFFNISDRSSNLKSELRNYIWKIDKSTGNPTTAPIDKHNHLIDALRYVIYTILGGNPVATNVFCTNQNGSQRKKTKVARRRKLW